MILQPFPRGRVLVAMLGVVAIAASTAAVDAQTFNPPLAGRPLPSATIAPILNDLEFVSAAAAINDAEIAEARLALARSQNPRVLAFAQRMLDDHATAAVQLQATTRGLGERPAPVSGITVAARAEYLRLAKTNDFDAQYMLAQVNDHQNAIATLNWETVHGQQAALRDYAARALPVVTMHLRAAQSFVASNGAALVMSPMTTGGTTAGGAANAMPLNGANAGPQGRNSPVNPTQPQVVPAAPAAYPIGGAGTPPPIFGSPPPSAGP